MTRKRLGRGLSTLLGDIDVEESSNEEFETSAQGSVERSSSQTLEVSVDRISPSPFQPRADFDNESLAELSASLKTHGMLEPLLVREDPRDPTRYQLIAGERRLRAARMAALGSVPMLVKSATDLEMLEMAIVENVQRENLNPIEEARGYRRLMDSSAQAGRPLSQQEVAEKVAKNRATVANLLRLLDLPEPIQETIENGRLTQGHGKVLAGLDPPLRDQVWKYALREQTSVRSLEKFIQKKQGESPLGERKAKEKTRQLDPHHEAIEAALQERLRTKVKFVRRKDESGYISINFFNNDDLDRLLESLDIEL